MVAGDERPAPDATAAALPPSALAGGNRLAPELAARLAGKRLALCLDYDGTLTPIVPRPEDAVLVPAMRERVRRLARRVPLAIVSGRDRAQVKAFVEVPEAAFVGSHGFDVEGPPGSGLRHEPGAPFTAALDAAEAALHARLDALPGAQVERKRYGVAAHWRRVAPALAPEVARAVHEVAAAEPRLVAKPGKMLLELVPHLEWDKGRAVLWLLEALGRVGPDVVALHVGDDLTDETVFQAFARATGTTLGDGIGIVVADGPRPTAAAFSLRDPDEVGAFLDALHADLLPPAATT